MSLLGDLSGDRNYSKEPGNGLSSVIWKPGASIRLFCQPRCWRRSSCPSCGSDPALETLSLEAVQGAKEWAVFSAVVALLALDVLLPVPSSVLSLFSGAALGFTVGALAIWTGMTLGCVLGGMIGGGLLRPLGLALSEGQVPPGKGVGYGWLGLVLCRPVPVLAEASVLLASANGMPLGRLVALTALANLPVALLYAWFGAAMLGGVPVIWLVVSILALTGVLLIARRLRP